MVGCKLCNHKFEVETDGYVDWATIVQCDCCKKTIGVRGAVKHYAKLETARKVKKEEMERAYEDQKRTDEDYVRRREDRMQMESGRPQREEREAKEAARIRENALTNPTGISCPKCNGVAEKVGYSGLQFVCCILLFPIGLICLLDGPVLKCRECNYRK